MVAVGLPAILVATLRLLGRAARGVEAARAALPQGGVDELGQAALVVGQLANAQQQAPLSRR